MKVLAAALAVCIASPAVAAPRCIAMEQVVQDSHAPGGPIEMPDAPAFLFLRQFNAVAPATNYGLPVYVVDQPWADNFAIVVTRSDGAACIFPTQGEQRKLMLRMINAILQPGML